MVIGLVISVMIAIVVGVALVPVIVSSVSKVENNSSGLPSSIGGVMEILSYVFVGVILLGAVAWIGGRSSSEGIVVKRPGQVLGLFEKSEAVPVAKEDLRIKEVKEMTIIEAEITPKEKLRSDEVGW